MKELMRLKKDLDYAYGQNKLSEETSRFCVIAVTRGNLGTSAALGDEKRDLKSSPHDLPTIFRIKNTHTKKN